jgi:hypothetical protein
MKGQNHIGGLRPLARGIGNACEADQTHVAVAANFNEPVFFRNSSAISRAGHKANLITEASSAFYTQITHGGRNDACDLCRRGSFEGAEG